MYVRRVKLLAGAVKKPALPLGPSSRLPRTSTPLMPVHGTVDTARRQGYLLVAEMRTLFLYVNRCGEAAALWAPRKLCTAITLGEQRADPGHLRRFPRQRRCDPNC
jgi:hypothetical protein